jgi:6-phosphogluconolactonase
MSDPTAVLRHDSPELLATAAAARLLARMSEVQAEGGVPSVVLTGGSVARLVHRAARKHVARDSVDWSRVDLWWGDERYVPADDPERNEAQARADLLDAVDLDAARVHPVAASDGVHGDDPDAAARAYARELAAAAPEGATAPVFDVVMLGMGPDGHVASLFPGHPAAEGVEPAFAVRNSPKPPPVRVSLSFATLNSAREVWFLVTGEAKGEMVRRVLEGAARAEVPAAGVRGLERTLWFVDEDAAARLPG